MSAGPDVSRLTPADAVAALRSFPRRFRAVLAWPEDEPRPAWFDEVAGHVTAAAGDLAAGASAVTGALLGTAPSTARAPEPGSTEAALDLLTLEATALADRVEHVDAHEWHDRPAGLDLLREAVRRVAAHLHAADEARRRAV